MTLRRRYTFVALTCALAGCSDGAEPGVSEAPPPAASTVGEAAPEPTRIEKSGGLVIEVLEPGEGKRVRSGDWITVHYTGRIAETDQTFGDTRKSGVPLSTWLKSSKVIRGWERGLDGMRVGTRLVLHIPAALAYGGRGMTQARIPPDADLVYEIEIMDTADRPARR
jgi:peptidylprolyl isomerase